MYSMKPLVLAVLATTASATYFNGEALRREVLEVRESISTSFETTISDTIVSITPYPTGTAAPSSSDVCSSVLQGLATLVTGLPTPTGALSSYLATAATTLTDPCNLSVPSSIAPAFSIYESSVISFYSAHSAQLNSALQACPSLTSLVANPVCSTSTGSASNATAHATGTTTQASVTATATKTTSPGSPSSPASPSPSSSATPSPVGTGSANEREINMVVLLAAGLFGAVIAVL